MSSPRFRRWSLAIIIVLILGGAGTYAAYRAVFGSPLSFGGRTEVQIYLYHDTPVDALREQFLDSAWLVRPGAWDLTARLMRFESKVPAGHYVIKEGSTSVALLRKLRAGAQDPVRLTFHGVRLPEDLAGRLAPQLRLDSLSILSALRDARFLEAWGLRPETATTLFIPNTYEVYWDMDEKGLMDRMQREYDAFWNADRLAAAAAAGLTATEAIILASIVQEETNKKDEMGRVAGVYINRLNRGMRLQADPTVKFATRNFGIRRVLTRDLEVDSPYNTYRVTGLPPGPITIPEPYVIDAVLSFEHHDYLFMCARADLSGYHAFARSNAQHEANAAAYQRALDRQGIYR